MLRQLLTNKLLIKLNTMEIIQLKTDYKKIICQGKNYTGDYWKITSEKRETITPRQLDLTTNVDTLQWFLNLGAKETIVKDNNGRISSLISVSPDGERKSVRQFEYKL